MFSIDKEFSYCYSHRVHSQVLNSAFSLTSMCKCRRLHGHQGVVKIGLQAEALNNDMVTDFNHLAWVKRIVDDVLDHRFIIDGHDPMLPMIFPEAHEFKECLVNHEWYTMFDTDRLTEVLKAKNLPEDVIGIILEKCSSMVMVDFAPTSENLCKWFYDIAAKEMEQFAQQEGFRVAYVEFWETPKSHCRYDAPAP